MPYRDEEKKREHNRRYASEHSSRERVKRFRIKNVLKKRDTELSDVTDPSTPCNSPVTDPVTVPKSKIEELRERMGRIEGKVVEPEIVSPEKEEYMEPYYE